MGQRTLKNLGLTTEYAVRVRARTGDSVSAWSEPLTFTTAAADPPSVPGTPSVIGIIAGLQISWETSPESDISHYQVHISESPGFTPDISTLAMEVSANTTQIFDLIAGTTYYVKIVAVNYNGVESAPSGEGSGTPTSGASDSLVPPFSPAPIVRGGVGFLAVEWEPLTEEDNPDPVTYEVHVSVSNGFSPVESTFAGEINGSIFFIKALPSGSSLAYGTTYYVKIVAYDKDGSAPPSVQASAQMTQVTGPDIAVNAVTAGSILAGTITGWTINASTLNSTSINSSTITSSTFKTASSGTRIEMSSGLPAYIRFFAPNGGETGYIYAYNDGVYNTLRVYGSSGKMRVETQNGDLTVHSSNYLYLDGFNGTIVGVGGSPLGFYGSFGSNKQNVVGSRGGNAALASLIGVLNTYGLIGNSTTP